MLVNQVVIIRVIYILLIATSDCLGLLMFLSKSQKPCNKLVNSDVRKKKTCQKMKPEEYPNIKITSAPKPFPFFQFPTLFFVGEKILGKFLLLKLSLPLPARNKSIAIDAAWFHEPSQCCRKWHPS